MLHFSIRGSFPSPAGSFADGRNTLQHGHLRITECANTDSFCGCLQQYQVCIHRMPTVQSSTFGNYHSNGAALLVFNNLWSL